MPIDNQTTIFFYPAWYPHRGDAMFGLFVKRHAEAVSAFVRTGVVFAVGETRPRGAVYDTVMSEEDGVHTVRVYFRKSGTKGFGTLLNGVRYLRAVAKGYRTLAGRLGRPDVNHVHVLTRAGLFPLYLRLFSGIPYLVTEHWSRYLPQNPGAYAGFLRKKLTEKIVRRAYAVLPVSPRLADAMKAHGLENDRYLIINNVVDTDAFVPEPHGPACIRWIHVSCFDDGPKNITGLLDAFAEARLRQPALHLTLVGDGVDRGHCENHARARSLGADAVTFTGLLQGEALRDTLRGQDAFVLFSRYENQPVVIIEAFACGLPVVATAVGSIPEMLAGNRGITVASEDGPALTEALLSMGRGGFAFSREAIRAYAVENFSFTEVGKRLYALYLAAKENTAP